MKAANRFPGFKYSASELMKHLAISDFFTILLTSGDIIHFTAKDSCSFSQWLKAHSIPDLRKEKGWIVD